MCLHRCCEVEDDAFFAVMKEQKYQRRHGAYDPDAICAAYVAKGAKQARVEAYNVGMLDYEKAVVFYPKSGNKIISRLHQCTTDRCSYDMITRARAA